MNKKLTRSSESKIFGGVCGGLGEYFEIDPILFRIIFLVLLFTAGSGLLLYIILWIIIPQKSILNISSPSSEDLSTKKSDNNTHKNSGAIIAGSILIVLGIIFLLNYYITWVNISKLWPLILIIIGVALIGSYIRENKQQKNDNNEER